jgi:hypothetical protein
MCAVMPQTTDVLTQKDVIELLMKKHAVMYSALLMRATSFTNHVRNNQLVATLMIAILSTAVHFPQFTLQNGTKRWWVLLTVVIVAVIYYLWYDTLDAHFAVVSHSARIKSLENQVNTIVGRKLLIWDTVVAPRLWGSWHPFKGVFHPVRLMLLYQVFLMCLIAVLFPLYVYYTAWMFPESTVRFKVCVALLAVSVLASLAVAVYVGYGLDRHLSDRLGDFINEHWEPLMIRDDGTSSEDGAIRGG